MPMSLRTLGVALQRLPELTQDMLDQERQMSSESRDSSSAVVATGSDSSNTIMSTLVHLSDQEKNQADKPLTREDKVSKSYLTEDEIAGNLFIFTAAGFDTTANTMSYAVLLLAAYPQWQTWIQSEIDTVLGAASTDDYATAFPMLTRCMAVMVRSNSSIHFSDARYTLSSHLVTLKLTRMAARNSPPLSTCYPLDAQHRRTSIHPVRSITRQVFTAHDQIFCTSQHHGPTHLAFILGFRCPGVQSRSLAQSMRKWRRACAHETTSRQIHPMVCWASRMSRPKDVAGRVRGCDCDII